MVKRRCHTMDWPYTSHNNVDNVSSTKSWRHQHQLTHVVIQEVVNRAYDLQIYLILGKVQHKHKDTQRIQFTLTNSGEIRFQGFRQPELFLKWSTNSMVQLDRMINSTLNNKHKGSHDKKENAHMYLRRQARLPHNCHKRQCQWGNSGHIKVSTSLDPPSKETTTHV